MRKYILLALMAFSMAAFAQKVTPLNIELTDLKLDSLRTLYSAEPTMYRASLEVLSQSLNKDAKAVAEAKSILKDEQAHSKEMGNSLKEANKMTAALAKTYSKEESTLKSMQKTVEKQQRKLSNQKKLTQEARDSYAQMLEKQQKELGYSLRELAERQRAVAELNTSLQDWQTQLQAFELQLNQKAADLTSLENQLKERFATLKAEQKVAKNL